METAHPNPQPSAFDYHRMLALLSGLQNLQDPGAIHNALHDGPLDYFSPENPKRGISATTPPDHIQAVVDKWFDLIDTAAASKMRTQALQRAVGFITDSVERGADFGFSQNIARVFGFLNRQDIPDYEGRADACDKLVFAFDHADRSGITLDMPRYVDALLAIATIPNPTTSDPAGHYAHLSHQYMTGERAVEIIGSWVQHGFHSGETYGHVKHPKLNDWPHYSGLLLAVAENPDAHDSVRVKAVEAVQKIFECSDGQADLHANMAACTGLNARILRLAQQAVPDALRVQAMESFGVVHECFMRWGETTHAETAVLALLKLRDTDIPIPDSLKIPYGEAGYVYPDEFASAARNTPHHTAQVEATAVLLRALFKNVPVDTDRIFAEIIAPACNPDLPDHARAHAVSCAAMVLRTGQKNEKLSPEQQKTFAEQLAPFCSTEEYLMNREDRELRALVGQHVALVTEVSPSRAQFHQAVAPVPEISSKAARLAAHHARMAAQQSTGPKKKDKAAMRERRKARKKGPAPGAS